MYRCTHHTAEHAPAARAGARRAGDGDGDDTRAHEGSVGEVVSGCQCLLNLGPQRMKAEARYATGPTNGGFGPSHQSQDVEMQRMQDLVQPAQLDMPAPLPGALARATTLPTSPHGVSSPLRAASNDAWTLHPERSAFSSGGSYNASFVNQEARRMRQLSTTTSQTELIELKARVGRKAKLIGTFSRDAKNIRAAHGDELGDRKPQTRHGEVESDYCTEIMERDCCCGRCRPIEADGKFRRRWDAVQVVLLLYVAIMVPLRTGFDDDGLMMAPLTALWWMELMVDLYFIVDIGLNFNTTYTSGETMVTVKKPAMIKANYLKSWFAIDFVACLPVSYIQQIAVASSGDAAKTDSSDDHLKLLKSLRLLRLAKLLRLARFRRIIKRWEEAISSSIMFSIQLGTLFFAVLFSAHIIACSWYLVGSYSDADGVSVRGNSISRLPSSGSGHSNVDLPAQQTTAHQTASLGVNSQQVGWVHRVVDGSFNFANQTLMYRYLRTYYWSVGLTSGSARGDIPPIVTAEYLFVITMEVVGTVALGLILGSLSSIFMTSRLLEDKVERQMAELREFLNQKGVPKNLRSRVRYYMELLYRHKTGYNEHHLMELLPPSLARELIEQLYHSRIEALPGMRGLPDEVRGKLCMAMKPIKALKNDIVFREGERANSVYVIETGVIELSRTAVVLTQLSAGAAFGEDSLVGQQHDGGYSAVTNALIGSNAKRERTATAVEESDLAAIEVREIGPIAETYPALHMRLAEFHSKRHAKEQQRLVKMLEAKARELGVSPDSAIITKIKEKAEALIEKSRLGEGTTEVMAALKIQRVYRGMRYRKELRRQSESKMVEDGLDLDKEAEKLLRRFSKTSSEIADATQSNCNVQTRRETNEPNDETISEVAKRSWKKLQTSRSEFQRQYKKSRQQAVSPTTLAEVVAKLDVVVQATAQLEDKVVREMDTRIQRYLGEATERYATEVAALRKALHSTSDTVVSTNTLSKTASPPVSVAFLPEQQVLGNGLDMTATEWLQSRGLGDLVGLLGTVGTTLSDLAMLTAEDVSALQLKALTRRRLRGHLSQLEGSKCVAPEFGALDGQQLTAAIEQQLRGHV